MMLWCFGLSMFRKFIKPQSTSALPSCRLLFFFLGQLAVLRPSAHMLPGTGWCGTPQPFPTACWWLSRPAIITCVSGAATRNSPGGCSSCRQDVVSAVLTCLPVCSFLWLWHGHCSRSTAVFTAEYCALLCASQASPHQTLPFAAALLSLWEWQHA